MPSRSFFHGRSRNAFLGDASVETSSGHKIERCVVEPDWPAPKKVRSIITLAQPIASDSGSEAGMAIKEYGHFNLALHVDDDRNAVMANRQKLATFTGIQRWQWLSQVHGTQVIQASSNRVKSLGSILEGSGKQDGTNMVSDDTPQADGCYTQESRVACAVLTADCLPLLLCNEQATQVAAVHAGWRGLADGVIEQAVAKFAQQDQLVAYLGPAIGPLAFEVGPEVKQAFSHYPNIEAAFSKSDRLDHYFADLYLLAKRILAYLGVSSIYGGTECTYTSNHHFYSYRREAKTGRMVSAIWLE